MAYYLNLEGVAPDVYERCGLIEVTRESAEGILARNGGDELTPIIYEGEQDYYVLLKGPEVSEREKLYASMQKFVAELGKWEGEDELKSVLADFGRLVSTETRAQVIFQSLAPNYDLESDKFTPETKSLAIELAEAMGPDWSQTFYHFAKLVTKLA